MKRPFGPYNKPLLSRRTQKGQAPLPATRVRRYRQEFGPTNAASNEEFRRTTDKRSVDNSALPEKGSLRYFVQSGIVQKRSNGCTLADGLLGYEPTWPGEWIERSTLGAQEGARGNRIPKIRQRTIRDCAPTQQPAVPHEHSWATNRRSQENPAPTTPSSQTPEGPDREILAFTPDLHIDGLAPTRGKSKQTNLSYSKGWETNMRAHRNSTCVFSK